MSLQALEKDELRRKVEGFLPTADVAFLDEIFKASGPFRVLFWVVFGQSVLATSQRNLRRESSEFNRSALDLELCGFLESLMEVLMEVSWSERFTYLTPGF